MANPQHTRETNKSSLTPTELFIAGLKTADLIAALDGHNDDTQAEAASAIARVLPDIRESWTAFDLLNAIFDEWGGPDAY